MKNLSKKLETMGEDNLFKLKKRWWNHCDRLMRYYCGVILGWDWDLFKVLYPRDYNIYMQINNALENRRPKK